jgi:hypothetical protein
LPAAGLPPQPRCPASAPPISLLGRWRPARQDDSGNGELHPREQQILLMLFHGGIIRPGSASRPASARCTSPGCPPTRSATSARACPAKMSAHAPGEDRPLLFGSAEPGRAPEEGSIAGLRCLAGDLRIHADVVEGPCKDRQRDRARLSAARARPVVVPLGAGYGPNDQPYKDQRRSDSHCYLRSPGCPGVVLDGYLVICG